MLVIQILVIAILSTMRRMSCIKMRKMSLSKGFTDDWEIHLQVDELEEFEAIHVGDDDIADHQFELVPILPLPKHVQP
jgi:hypothetical protein